MACGFVRAAKVKTPNDLNCKDYKVNMFEAGILDTIKASKLQINAVSASNNLLRTNNAITYERFLNSKWKINSSLDLMSGRGNFQRK
jgi:chaperonin GroEL (HSP60 family)